MTDHARTRTTVAAGALSAVLAAAIAGWVCWPTSHSALEIHTGTTDDLISATIATPRLGTTDVEITVHPRNGAVPVSVETVHVQAVMLLMGYASAPVTATPIAATPNGYRVGALPLMMTGPWQLRVSLGAATDTENLVLPFWVSG